MLMVFFPKHYFSVSHDRFTRSEKETREDIQRQNYTSHFIVKCPKTMTTLFEDNEVVQKYIK